MALKKREFTPESGSVDTYGIAAAAAFIVTSHVVVWQQWLAKHCWLADLACILSKLFSCFRLFFLTGDGVVTILFRA